MLILRFVRVYLTRIMCLTAKWDLDNSTLLKTSVLQGAEIEELS